MSSILSKTSINRNRLSCENRYISRVSCRNKVVSPFLKLIFQATWMLLKGCCQLPLERKASSVYLQKRYGLCLLTNLPKHFSILCKHRVLLSSCTSFSSSLPSQACQPALVQVICPHSKSLFCSQAILSTPSPAHMVLEIITHGLGLSTTLRATTGAPRLPCESGGWGLQAAPTQDRFSQCRADIPPLKIC